MQAAEAFLEQDYIAGASFSLADIAAFTSPTSAHGQDDWDGWPKMTR
jgi:glutathione S-transferase